VLLPEVDYLALRRSEDAAAAASLGIEPPLWLPFREAPHRGYGSAQALFAGVRPDDGIDRDVSEALRAVLRDLAPDLILAPQAVGGHVDHIQLVRALQRLAPAAPALFWRDFPYTVREANPSEPFRSDLERLDPIETALTPDRQERKRRACRAYASQLGFQFGDLERMNALLADAKERFRCTEASMFRFLSRVARSQSGDEALNKTLLENSFSHRPHPGQTQRAVFPETLFDPSKTSHRHPDDLS
jgi:LmbE family N-acetylglucosaminyl deacetylase